MKLLVLGRIQDGMDHALWCQQMGHEVRYVDPQAADSECAENVDDIVSFADRSQQQVERLRIACGLPSRGLNAVAILTNKVFFKAHPAIKPHVVRHIEIDTEMSADTATEMVGEHMRFPVVVKPSNAFYSAGVVRVDSPAEVRAAYVHARRICVTLAERASPAKVIVEQYLDGNEFAVDGFVLGTQVHPLLLHRKRPRLEGPTFHESAYLTECFDTTRGTKVVDMLEQIIGGVGLRDSAFHAEFRFDADGKLHVLEVAPRLAGGGATTHQLMSLCTGLDAYACLHRLGRGPVDVHPLRRGTGLEYDFGPETTGVLCNVAEIASACEQRGASRVIRYRTDGDMVFGPPSNLECVLTAFFDCESIGASQTLFDEISNNYRIRTI